MSIADAERTKYARIWAFPPYSKMSPGAKWATLFGEVCHPSSHDIIIDFGCGHGDGGRALNAQFGVKVLYQEITGGFDCDLPLWLPTPLRGTYGYCCDVLEHLPEQFTMLAVANMRHAVEKQLFLSISFEPDRMGAAIRDTLHLTVRPFEWWRESLSEIAPLKEARDMLGEGIFVL